MAAGSADGCSVKGESGLADALAVAEFLVITAVVARGAVGSRLAAGGADGADTTDASKSLEADATLGGVIVDFIGLAFLGADAELVGVESGVAVAPGPLFVVGRVDRTGHTVSVADEVVVRASLTFVVDESEAIEAFACLGSFRVG